jgi:DNA-binding MarR family transcriptional regulator
MRQIVAMTTNPHDFAGSLSPGTGRQPAVAREQRAARSLLGRASMNSHFFGTKRAFHGILRITRRPLWSFGLTAARYDMLYAICGCIPKPGSVGCTTFQRDLPRKLGVHKSVVSRMLRSLEEIGLIARSRIPYADQRLRVVALTKAGRERMHAAAQCLVRAGKRLLCMAICFGRNRDPDERFRHMSVYESYLNVIRQHFGDTAWLPYRWHPDD